MYSGVGITLVSISLSSSDRPLATGYWRSCTGNLEKPTSESVFQLRQQIPVLNPTVPKKTALFFGGRDVGTPLRGKSHTNFLSGSGARMQFSSQRSKGTSGPLEEQGPGVS